MVKSIQADYKQPNVFGVIHSGVAQGFGLIERKLMCGRLFAYHLPQAMSNKQAAIRGPSEPLATTSMISLSLG